MAVKQKQKQSVKQSVRQSVVVRIEHPKPKRRAPRRSGDRVQQLQRIQYTPAPVSLQSSVNQEKMMYELNRLQDYIAKNLNKPLGERTGDLMETPPTTAPSVMMPGLSAAQREDESRQTTYDAGVARSLQRQEDIEAEARKAAAETEARKAEQAAEAIRLAGQALQPEAQATPIAVSRLYQEGEKRGKGRPRNPVKATLAEEPGSYGGGFVRRSASVPPSNLKPTKYMNIVDLMKKKSDPKAAAEEEEPNKEIKEPSTEEEPKKKKKAIKVPSVAEEPPKKGKKTTSKEPKKAK